MSSMDNVQIPASLGRFTKRSSALCQSPLVRARNNLVVRKAMLSDFFLRKFLNKKGRLALTGICKLLLYFNCVANDRHTHQTSQQAKKKATGEALGKNKGTKCGQQQQQSALYLLDGGMDCSHRGYGSYRLESELDPVRASRITRSLRACRGVWVRWWWW